MNFEVQFLCHSILGPIWFFFFFFITHHSLLNFCHSLLFTHHLKYPNFPNPTRLAHVFSFSSLNFFYFLWDHTWARHKAFPLAYPPHTISSFHIAHCSFPFQFNPQYSPQTRDFNPGIPFFFSFFLQPPIPTTTTSVLSLKHKPRKFTSPQQSIRCPNRCFYFFFIFFMGLRWEMWKGRKKKEKKKKRT